MLILLALACQPLSSVSDTQASSVPELAGAPVDAPRTPAVASLPSGGMTLRTCDLALPQAVLRRNGLRAPSDAYEAEAAASGNVMGGGGYGMGGVGTTASRSPSRAQGVKAAPKPSASAPSAPMSAPVVAALPSASYDSLAESGAMMADEARAGDGRLARPMKTIAAEKKADDGAKGKAERSREELDESARPLADVIAPRGPKLDWGATIYLSNDDTMSLASAQRLLWAAQQNAQVTPDQVRPHELLNYFSFETRAPGRGDVFGVTGSAAQLDGDSLTLAFAVEGAHPERQPLDLTMVLDRSGSMSAEGRMEYLKRGLHKLQGQLQRGDRVNLVLFDHESCTPVEGYVHGRDDAGTLSAVIDALQPRGSTDLDLGLRDGYALANKGATKGRNDRVLLLSDALLNTGDVNPNTVSEIGRAYEQRGVRLSAVGVGRDFNDKVLDMLTEKGKGAYVYLGSESVVDRIFGTGFDSLVQTIAHDVHFSVDLPESLAMERFYGEEASTNKADVQPIHYYAGTKQLFLQDVHVREGQVRPSDVVTFHVEYTDALTGKARTQSWASSVGSLMASDDHNLVKGRALMAWSDLQLAKATGQGGCGEAFSVWQDRASAVEGDAEIAWLDGLTSPRCSAQPVAYRPRVKGVEWKLRVDSDVPIAEVALSCGSGTRRASLGGSTNVARFASVAPGSCTVTLDGIVPMVAQVEVSSVGGQGTCRVRGGRVTCS
jgi:Ca-activated chloride channel family protein